MIHRVTAATVFLAVAALVIASPALAQEPVLPIPISSEQAYDAVMAQVDPLSGESKNVVLVDTRTRAEFYWVGTTAKVDQIVLHNGKTLTPDMGKVKLTHEGKFLEFEAMGRPGRVQTATVDSVSLSPIARSIPYELWNETTGALEPNGMDFVNFRTAVEALATDENVDVVIFFCRSGGRSQACLAYFDTTLFDEVYEIDQPDGQSGYGGFEGTTYGSVYNGYRGFPGRMTYIQDHESVAWKDAGLPIKIGVNPLP
jgi:rhodanese-related sulfurtransferase